MITSTLLLAGALGWWPYPAVDACPEVLAILGSGTAATSAVARLDALGPTAVPFVLDGLGSRPDTLSAIAFLEILATHHDARAHAAIRPYVFHPEPTVAALATRVLFLTSGARAQPTLEHALSTPNSFAASLAAIEGLREAGIPTSFTVLAAFVADPSRDSTLRELALESMIKLAPRESDRWLGRLPATTRADPWLAPRLAELKATIAEARRGER